MMIDISRNTQAVLLLTAPLIAGRNVSVSETLTPGEYNRLGRHLRELKLQPSDLMAVDATEIINACQPIVDSGRLRRLLSRGFLLSQAIERWHARAIWVLSRSDAGYPQRMKARLGESAPAVIYGCGDSRLLESGGLAVVGSRDVDSALMEYTIKLGKLAACSGLAIISGGARGTDQAAMRGALESGGSSCGVLSDSLEKTVMDRENRNTILHGKLVLISPYDPNAGFLVGNAMQRNKLIYSLANIALVVNSDFEKGGTWSGAKEQLDKFHLVPVFVRSTGPASRGLDALLEKGAVPWPNPQNEEELQHLYETSSPDTRSTTRQPEQPAVMVTEKPGMAYSSSSDQGETSSDQLRDRILGLLTKPMKEKEIVALLASEKVQVKAKLKQLVDAGILEKRLKPITFAVKPPDLFDVLAK